MMIHALLGDGRFTIEGPESLLAPWLPYHAAPASRARAHLLLEPAPLGVVPLSMPSTLSLLDVGAWVDGEGVLLRSGDGRQDGVLELAGPGGSLGATPGAHVEPLLTIATALLLGRMDHALIHAAAVVSPGGKVWLLVGDTHAGKSTTVATLVRAGWGWLADDQVVVHRSAHGLVAEGWPRAPNLDTGYEEGRITGTRQGVTFELFGAPPLAGPHPLGGVVLPAVDAGRPTGCRPASSAEAFVALVRQSPWLLADVASAPRLNELLAGVAALPAARLQLGRDSYGRGGVLAEVLGEVVEGRPRP
jgi:hypothetical protein